MKNQMLRTIMILIVGTAMQAHGVTREEAVNAATAEAGYSYSSAADKNLRYLNVFRSQYTYGGCAYSNSPTWEQVGNGVDSLGYPNPFSWSGAPYCYGNSKMGASCQAEINAGKGVGATFCQYSANGSNTSSWATGVDCAEAVGQWLGYAANTQSTYNLETNSDPISWERLQPGDILLKTSGGRHVMMFVGWSPYPYPRIIEASASKYRVIEITTIDTTGWSSLQYYPRSMRNLFGDPVASILYFIPSRGPGGLVLRWETALERETHSFRIEKSAGPRGPWQPIGDWVIANSGGGCGGLYVVRDPNYNGLPSFYRLIELEYSGRKAIKRTILVNKKVLSLLEMRRRIRQE